MGSNATGPERRATTHVTGGGLVGQRTPSAQSDRPVAQRPVKKTGRGPTPTWLSHAKSHGAGTERRRAVAGAVRRSCCVNLIASSEER